MPNSAISTIPLLVIPASTLYGTCSATNLKLAAIVRARFEAFEASRGETSTTPTWPHPAVENKHGKLDTVHKSEISCLKVYVSNRFKQLASCSLQKSSKYLVRR